MQTMVTSEERIFALTASQPDKRPSSIYEVMLSIYRAGKTPMTALRTMQMIVTVSMTG